MGHDSEQVQHDADTTAEQDDLVGVAEASRLLHVSPDAVRARCRRGKLPSVKIDGRIMIPHASLGVPTVDTTGRHDANTTESVADTTRHDADTTESVGDTTGRHDANTTTWPLTDTTATRQGDRRPEPVHAEWREDLLAQVARLEADKADWTVRLDEAARRETEAGRREERSKARVIDLERELTVRDSRAVDIRAERDGEVTELRGQVAILEAKVREILEDGKNEALQLANRNADLADRIADLVASHEDMHARVVELQPVAEQVPMLQAAVEEKDADLSERERELNAVRQDIEAIASRPVTGPVFRLLTKGKLRR
jgi:hypothetical protein